MKRLEVLRELDGLAAHCETCTKVKQGPYKDSMASDREICRQCPVGMKMAELGSLLEKQTKEGRRGKKIPKIQDAPYVYVPSNPTGPYKQGPTPDLTYPVYMQHQQDGLSDTEIADQYGLRVNSLRYWSRKWRGIGQ